MRKIKEFKRIRTILIVVAIIIAFISLFVSQSLVKDLSREEHSKMELFADAYRSLDDADENTDLGLVLAVISGNKTIPVIVVDESSTDGSADILKQLKTENPHLYTTFLPKYHFRQNHRRLAFTLGVKAAKKEWIIFTDITTPPPFDQWIPELEEFATKSTELLLGYFSKKGDVTLTPYDDISQAASIITKAERWRAGIGHDQWLRYIRRSANYNFIVVRANRGHDVLRLFAAEHRLQASKE